MENAREHNLKSIDASIPARHVHLRHRRLGFWQVDPGQRDPVPLGRQSPPPARSRPGAHDGVEGIDQIDKIIDIDQSPIGRTPRSNPATYTGLFDVIRDIYSKTKEARARGYKPGRFSFNVKGGRCEVCRGDGRIKVEMHFLADVYVPVRAVPRPPLQPGDARGPLQGPVDRRRPRHAHREALEFFEAIPKIEAPPADAPRRRPRLHPPRPARDHALGGEAQRVKLATELSKIATGGTLYILDEPTTGLHFADVGVCSRSSVVWSIRATRCS